MMANAMFKANSIFKASAMIKKVRGIRCKGKKQIMAINERLNSVAWRLSASNADINDPNMTQAINSLDEALETLQVATALLNTVSVDEAMIEAVSDPAERKSLRSLLPGKQPALKTGMEPELNPS